MSGKSIFTAFALILCLIFDQSVSAPVGCQAQGRNPTLPSVGGNLSPIDEFLNTQARAAPNVNVNITKYLKDYGYLSDGDEGSEAKETEAIYEFQKKANLEPTGRMNLDTYLTMSKPRCANEDKTPAGRTEYSKFFPVPENATDDPMWRFKLGPTGSWKSPDIKWRINSYTKDLPREDVHRVIEKAWKVWADVSGLTFREVGPGEDTDFNIEFVRGAHKDGSDFDGPGGVLAHAFYPRNGRAHFDDDEKWALGINEPGAINLEWVAIHEFGHGLGLDHSDKLDAVMYPFYPGFVESIDLRQDDIDGIQKLYGPNPNNPSAGGSSGDSGATGGSGGSTGGSSGAPVKTGKDGKPYPFSTARPRSCTDNIQAAFTDPSGNVQMFSAGQFWSFDNNGVNVMSPLKVAQHFPYFQSQIDAAVTLNDGRVLIFTTFYVSIYETLDARASFKYNEELGLDKFASVDAVVKYPTNGKLYVFQGSDYYRMDPDTLHVDPGYPRQISRGWPGLPDNIDAALDLNGQVYLFRGDQYWWYDTSNNRIGKDYPRSFSEDWLKCQQNARSDLDSLFGITDLEP